ncbi:MAG: CHRD domain-containing protein [Candidatus Eisenbacteria bacterium]
MTHARSTAAGVVMLAASLVFTTAAARAETLFLATLDGTQSVPPTASGATGSAVLILNDAQTEVSYAISYVDLEGNEIAAHFHNGIPGENGPIMHSLPAGTPKFGTWPVDAHDVGHLLGGRVYVNVHTDLFPGDEIRGDVSLSTTAVPEGPVRMTWGKIKALFG